MYTKIDSLNLLRIFLYLILVRHCGPALGQSSSQQEQGYSVIDEAYLFDKGQRLDRITLKNQIAYHFQQKVVKEVTHELFISRLIHVEPIIHGIDALNRTAVSLKQYCERREVKPGYFLNKPFAVVKSNSSGFIYITRGDYTFREAKARCEALGYQLPEIYTDEEARDFIQLAKRTGIHLAFAGIELDDQQWIFRHIATQLPIWKGWYSYANNTQHPYESIQVGKLASRTKGTFFYHKLGGLRFLIDDVYPANFGQIKDFWIHRGGVQEHKIPGLVCQHKWSGMEYTNLYSEHGRSIDAGISIVNSYARAAKREQGGGEGDWVRDPSGSSSGPKAKRATSDYSESFRTAESRSKNRKAETIPAVDTLNLSSEDLNEVCDGVVSQIEEFYKDALEKMNNLLSLVDIKMVLDSQDSVEVNRESYGGRYKRFGSLLSKILFKKGTKMLWSLFGFYQQIRTDRKIKKNAQDINQLKSDVDDLRAKDKSHSESIEHNRKQILEATNVLKEHSIAIEALVVATKDLDNRLGDVENRVRSLVLDLERVKDQMEIVTTILLMTTLVSRVSMAIDSGYEQLAEIVHASLLGQTSPLVLPLAQMAEVQLRLKEKSVSAVLDKDFSKMKSIVTADPENPGLLLVIINAVAVSHINLELIHMIPVPYYDGERAYTPILDYNYAALNQPGNVFTVLSDDEAEDCVTGRCYISQMEQSLYSQTCGMPQYQDHQLDACDVDSVAHDGMFIQSANPDGVVFSFREQVTIQLFCNENTYIGTQRKISGAGVMFIPSGCTLTAQGKKGQTVRVKGGPSHYLIEVSNLDLAKDTILSSPASGPVQGNSPKRPAAETALAQQLVIVQESMDSAHKNVNELQRRLWITAGCLLGIILVISGAVALLYRYSRRFKHRFDKAVGNLAELRDKLLDIEKIRAAVTALTPRTGRRFRPVAPPRVTLPADHDYIHLTNQLSENDRQSHNRRDYVRMPLTRSASALISPDLPFRQTVAKRPDLNTISEERRRLYPECPDKGSDSEDETRSQCKSMGDLRFFSNQTLPKVEELRK